MKLPAPARRNDEEHILPLINVVFLLLLFFMIVGRMTITGSVPVNPVTSQSQGATKAGGLLIELDRHGTVTVENEQLDTGELDAFLRTILTSSTGKSVRLKADSQVEALRVIEVMRKMRSAGIEHLQLLTVAPDSL